MRVVSSTTTIAETPVRSLPWVKLAWFGGLIAICYAPILYALVLEWSTNDDMGHGFFVPIISAFIVWQRREELLALRPRPNWWGLLVVALGCLQLMVATLGVELSTARGAFVVTLIGSVWLLGGTQILRKVAFPLFLLFFMIPIPAVIYNQITFPLQQVASFLAASALSALDIPVLRTGNILDLPSGPLAVVEACSGIRSLLSLTFLALVYGYFFEPKRWIRVVLFVATIPIAILANGSRVAVTGILAQWKPELAEGFFHESTGWVIFMIALAFLIIFHQLLVRTMKWVDRRKAGHGVSQ
jgi:exosortase